jgi:hypothetical protein
MKILFLTSEHNSLSQRLFIELTERGHAVAVALATSEEAMVTAVAQQVPDVIIKGSVSTLLNCINCIEYEYFSLFSTFGSCSVPSV